MNLGAGRDHPQLTSGDEPSPPRGGMGRFLRIRESVRAFTLIELLVVLAVIGLLASVLGPALGRAKTRVRGVVCLNHLKQWGLAAQLYAVEHDDFLPDEGPPAPAPGPVERAWYVALPRMLSLAPYHEMPWRTNAALLPVLNLFLCPSNPRRATNQNLFHYCLNEHIDGTGVTDRPRRLSSVERPSDVVYLFDNGKQAAVAQQNNVHTNLHSRGAQFVFLDAHARRFGNTEYWDFRANRGRTNHPSLVWIP